MSPVSRSRSASIFSEFPAAVPSGIVTLIPYSSSKVLTARRKSSRRYQTYQVTLPSSLAWVTMSSQLMLDKSPANDVAVLASSIVDAIKVFNISIPPVGL
ncbi:hypothetical protein N9565_01515 [Amylibacter sp.]|nr:hypothetical protein [Amylibacter sp.]